MMGAVGEEHAPHRPSFGFGFDLLLCLTCCVILEELLDQSEPHLPSEG